MDTFFSVIIFPVVLVVAILLGVIYYIESYADFLKTHKRLHISIRKLEDGRYRVRYYWSVWEDHTEYVSAELLPAYLSDLVFGREKK